MVNHARVVGPLMKSRCTWSASITRLTKYQLSSALAGFVQSQAYVPNRLCFSKISLIEAAWADETARIDTAAAAISSAIDLARPSRKIIIVDSSVFYIVVSVMLMALPMA